MSAESGFDLYPPKNPWNPWNVESTYVFSDDFYRRTRRRRRVNEILVEAWISSISRLFSGVRRSQNAIGAAGAPGHEGRTSQPANRAGLGFASPISAHIFKRGPMDNAGPIRNSNFQTFGMSDSPLSSAPHPTGTDFVSWLKTSKTCSRKNGSQEREREGKAKKASGAESRAETIHDSFESWIGTIRVFLGERKNRFIFQKNRF